MPEPLTRRRRSPVRTRGGSTGSDYYRSFYVDSAIQGSIGGIQASYAFYGADHILFGTDMPYASQNGDGNTKCIASINALGVPAAEKDKMFGGNLLRLIGH